LIDDDDEIEYYPQEGVVINHTNNKRISVAKMPQIMIDILNSGGVIEYIKSQGK